MLSSACAIRVAGNSLKLKQDLLGTQHAVKVVLVRSRRSDTVMLHRVVGTDSFCTFHRLAEALETDEGGEYYPPEDGSDSQLLKKV